MEESVDHHGGAEKTSPPGSFIEATRKLSIYIKLLWGARKELLKVNAIVLVVALFILFFVVHPYFESTITFLPDYGNKSMLAGLSGLASSLAGIDLGQASPNEIFEDIVYSDAVLEPVIYAKYKTEEFKDSVNLLDYFDVSPASGVPIEKRERSRYRKFHKRFTRGYLETNVTGLTKILTITVTMPESKLSADVANNIAMHLDEYVRTQRKSYASVQRFYIEKRIDQVKDSLDGQEMALERFREQNRVVEQSPQLLLEQSRLMRTVDILSSVYIQLKGQLELTKLDEIKDTPIVNVREEATDPVIKSGPLRLLILIVVMFFSGIASCGFYLYREEIKQSWNTVKDIFRGAGPL